MHIFACKCFKNSFDMLTATYQVNDINYNKTQWNLYHPTLCYPNFQLSDLKSPLLTPFKAVTLGFPLSDLIVTLPRGSDNGGSTV